MNRGENDGMQARTAITTESEKKGYRFICHFMGGKLGGIGGCGKSCSFITTNQAKENLFFNDSVKSKLPVCPILGVILLSDKQSKRNIHLFQSVY